MITPVRRDPGSVPARQRPPIRARNRSPANRAQQGEPVSLLPLPSSLRGRVRRRKILERRGARSSGSACGSTLRVRNSEATRERPPGPPRLTALASRRSTTWAIPPHASNHPYSRPLPHVRRGNRGGRQRPPPRRADTGCSRERLVVIVDQAANRNQSAWHLVVRSREMRGIWSRSSEPWMHCCAPRAGCLARADDAGHPTTDPPGRLPRRQAMIPPFPSPTSGAVRASRPASHARPPHAHHFEPLSTRAPGSPTLPSRVLSLTRAS
jgi:hypothetical protein